MATGQYMPPAAFRPPYRHARSGPPLGFYYPQVPGHSSFPVGRYQTASQIPNCSWGPPPTSAPGPSPSASGYAPVQYDSPYGGGDFYGSLIDASGRPSGILARLVDALFFYMDRCCDLAQLRGTNTIEPAKLSWLALQMGSDQATTGAREELRQSFYDAGSIPYTMSVVNGRQVPVLDRRGFLHMFVYSLRATPIDGHEFWNKVLNMFRLADPATCQPFPTPIPRSAFPTSPDITLSRSHTHWQTEVSRVVGSHRAQASMSQFSKPAAAVTAGGATGVSADYFAQVQGMPGSGTSVASEGGAGPSLATNLVTSASEIIHGFVDGNNSTSNPFGTTPSFNPNPFGVNDPGSDPNSIGLNNQGFDPNTNPGGYGPSSFTGLADSNIISGVLDPKFWGALFN